MNSTRFKDTTNGLGCMHAGLKLFGVLYTFSLLIEESMTQNTGEVLLWYQREGSYAMPAFCNKLQRNCCRWAWQDSRLPAMVHQQGGAMLVASVWEEEDRSCLLDCWFAQLINCCRSCWSIHCGRDCGPKPVERCNTHEGYESRHFTCKAPYWRALEIDNFRGTNFSCHSFTFFPVSSQNLVHGFKHEVSVLSLRLSKLQWQWQFFSGRDWISSQIPTLALSISSFRFHMWYTNNRFSQWIKLWRFCYKHWSSKIYHKLFSKQSPQEKEKRIWLFLLIMKKKEKKKNETNPSEGLCPWVFFIVRIPLQLQGVVESYHSYHRPTHYWLTLYGSMAWPTLKEWTFLASYCQFMHILLERREHQLLCAPLCLSCFSVACI